MRPYSLVLYLRPSAHVLTHLAFHGIMSRPAIVWEESQQQCAAEVAPATGFMPEKSQQQFFDEVDPARLLGAPEFVPPL